MIAALQVLNLRVREARVSRTGLAYAARNVAYFAVALVAAVWAYFWIRFAVGDGSVGFDFEGTLWDAAIAIRDGRSPYPAPILSKVDIGNPALYPPLLMFLIAPLTVLPWTVGVIIWTVLLAAAISGSLYALDVRDPRCHLLALISAPVVGALIWGNVTPLLVLLVALSWRWREHWVRTGILVGLAIASKLFLWPLLIWLLGTRRYRAFGAAVLAIVAGVLIPWAAIGFTGLASYPDLLRAATQLYAVHSYSVSTILGAFGIETELATRSAVALGFAIAVLAFLAGRRREDELSISIAVVAAILGSPVVWNHYYALLLVPLAIVRPRFSSVWVILALFQFAQMLPRPGLRSTELEPGGIACCKPDDVAMTTWVFTHAPPSLWLALGHVGLAILVAVAVWAILASRWTGTALRGTECVGRPGGARRADAGRT